MSFTVKPTRKNVQWIKKNIEKDARKVENAALDRWTAEGGFVADETKVKLKKKVLVYRKHRSVSPQHLHRRWFR